MSPPRITTRTLPLRCISPNQVGASPSRGLSTARQVTRSEEQPPGLILDPKRGGSLTDRAALEQVKGSGILSQIGWALVDNPRLQDPGQCHINALQNVHEHAAGRVESASLDLIQQLGQQSQASDGARRAVLGKMASLLQLLMHFKVSVTGRPPQGFENAESQKLIDTPQAMAAMIKARQALVVQGSGKAVTASDSDLRKPLPPECAIEMGQPTVAAPDGSVNSNHSIVVLAVATPWSPVPGLAPGQCLVFDQDPHRVCIRHALEKAGWSQTPPHELTPPQIKEAGVDFLMTRVVSFDDLCQTHGTGNAGILPMGGLIGGRFFVPLRRLCRSSEPLITLS